MEPFTTAVLFTTFAALVVASVVFARASDRTGIPVTLIFLAIGIAAGSDGLGGIEFTNYDVAFRVGTAALVFILFDGGLNTPATSLRRSLAPASLLATVGVVGTAAITAAGSRLLGFQWPQALLLGAIVSSTDAASVFVVLRRSGIGLRRRVGTTLEVESGLNDPMAWILTVGLTTALVNREAPDLLALISGSVLQLAIGAAGGYVIGWLARRILARMRLSALGLYPVLTLAASLIAFGIPTIVGGSGFLSVYIVGVMLGNGPLPYRGGVLRSHDALAWLSQIVMFLVFGLLVFPRQLPQVALPGLLLALLLAFIARPAIAAACLLPFRFSKREVGYIGWVGLRGAVPIVLSIYPVLQGAPGAHTIFNIVFFVVVVNALLPGTTVSWATRLFGLEVDEPPRPHAILALESMEPLAGELMTFYIDDALAVAGERLTNLPFPEGAAVALIIRGNELVPPKGSTELKPGDHVYLFARPEDRYLMQLMFGRPEEE